MAQLHEALKLLAHADWDEIPQTDLANYLPAYFAAGELLCNSVPLPPNGTPLDSLQPHFQTPNAAKSAGELYPSPARPRAPHDDHASLQKSWGKPMKFSQKENPLQVAMYKMAGHDRHGAWFARHNIFEGISFSKFKKAVLREFPETLLTQGAPGEGAIRGLSAERRVERIDAGNGGRVEVYQLSAQMPPPVSPRDFLTLFLTTDQALTEKSPTGNHNGSTYIPRHFMVVSRSLDHPDVPHRSDFVRGSYQSVELAREIPLHTVTNGDPELNPIEWIMVTRSDPAGGIPRFLIDRGTPGAMLADVSKFLNWACKQEEIADPDGDVEKQQEVSAQFGDRAEELDGAPAEGASEKIKRKSDALLNKGADQLNHENPAQQEVSHDSASAEISQPPTREVAQPPDSTHASQAQNQGGSMLSNLSSSLEAGITAYAPLSVSNFVSKQIRPETATNRNHQIDQDDDDDSTTSDSSSDSFLSAHELERLSTAPEHAPNDNAAAESTLSVDSGVSTQSLSAADKKNLNRHEKEVLKIAQQREKLDSKTIKKREAEEAKFRASEEKDLSERDKARERMEKELQKTTERHRKEVEKLERKREKELKKAEERRAKKDEQNRISLLARERDDVRSLAELLRKENSLLAEQVESLQRENTALADALGRVAGPEMLGRVLSEAEKGVGGGGSKKGESRASLSSEKSGERKEG